MKPQAGFSYIEVLVAMALIGLLVPVLMSSFIGAEKAVDAGEKHLVAVRLAQQVLEEARSTGSAEVLDWDGRVEDPVSDHPGYVRKTEVQWAEGYTLRVAVLVEWGPSDDPSSVQLSTLIYVGS